MSTVIDYNELENEALQFIRELIQIESVNTGVAETIGDGETRASRYIEAKLIEVGYETHFVEPIAGRGSVVARLTGSDSGRGALVVHAHVDVVPVDGQQWQHPPFGAEIHEGLLYGRGSVDMKNFAGTILAIARAYRRAGIVPQRDLIFAFFADEEAGGVWGARWLVTHRPELFAGATEAISEVGGFSIPLPDDHRAYLVATAEKGVTSAELRATGRAGHGSRPTADNAVVRIAQAVAAVGAHRFPITRTPAIEAFLDRVGSQLGVDFDSGELEAQLEQLGFASSIIAAGLRDTASPTVLDAGGKRNVIPSEARAAVDVRILPGNEHSYRAALQAVVGEDIAIHWGATILPIASPVDSPLLGVVQRAITDEDANGIVVPYLLPASTDNKHLAALGIAGYGFVPLRVPHDFDVFSQFHTSDEHIPVESLRFLARVTERILRQA